MARDRKLRSHHPRKIPKNLLNDCPAGRAHYAWSGHFVTCIGLRAGAPVGRKLNVVPTNRRTNAKPAYVTK